MDLIQAYRIAFAVKLDGANLYDYWVPKLTTPLLEDVRKVGGIMVNLTSMDIQGARLQLFLKYLVRKETKKAFCRYI